LSNVLLPVKTGPTALIAITLPLILFNFCIPSWHTKIELLQTSISLND